MRICQVELQTWLEHNTQFVVSKNVMPGQRWWRDECLMQPGTDVPKKQVLSPQHAEQYGHNLPKLPLMHLHGC